MKKFLLLLSVLLVFTSSIPAFADETSLTEFEVLPGVMVNIDVSKDKGEVSVMLANGQEYNATYEIIDTVNDEYILFTKKEQKLFSQRKNLISQNSLMKGTYYVNGIVRTYRKDVNYPTSIYYSEYASYGYAAGTINMYAVGMSIDFPAYIDIYYHGNLFYSGGVLPDSVDKQLH